MKLEERGLPPSLRYVNQRLTGQPLFAVTWLIVMLGVGAAIIGLDRDETSTEALLVVWALALDFIICLALLSVAIRRDGRKWLWAKYNDEGQNPVSVGSRVVIRLLPFIGLFVIGEYLFLR